MNQYLEVISLCFTHVGRSQPTIQDVNLTLHPGEIVLIAGATGSGKSTLLNCLAGIAPTHTGGKLSGEILYQGRSILEQSVRQRSQFLGTILQNVETQLFTDLVTEELAFGLENLNTPPDRIPLLIDAALSEFGLGSQRHWSITQLSAGQKQRLVLACVLAMGQPILLLDEPFAYLDRSGGDLLLQLLQTRAKQGQSVLLIEHRFDLVQEVCDRVYQFQDGELVERTGNKGSRNWGMDDGEKEKTEVIEPARDTSFPLPALTLQTQNLSWNGYPAFPDLEVQAGEAILLKGDNGCGKTTLLKLLSGLLKPSTGALIILGRDVRKQKVVKIAQTVGFVLQNPNHQLFAESVWQEVWQPKVTPQTAEQILQQLNLYDRKDQHPQSLSQGQKRRLALGAVLARNPKICLLDEITVGQDPRSLTLMLNALKNFTQQGGTLILTSHDPQAATYLNARVVKLESLQETRK
jgi:energy-coupling factor transport system ATP-binding protein